MSRSVGDMFLVLAQMLDFYCGVIGELRKLAMERFDQRNGVADAIEKIRIAESDVFARRRLPGGGCLRAPFRGRLCGTRRCRRGRSGNGGRDVCSRERIRCNRRCGWFRQVVARGVTIECRQVPGDREPENFGAQVRSAARVAICSQNDRPDSSPGPQPKRTAPLQIPRRELFARLVCGDSQR